MKVLNEKYAAFEIDEERKTPKYLQVIDCVTNAIKQGSLEKMIKFFLSMNAVMNTFYPVIQCRKHMTFWNNVELSALLKAKAFI